MSKLKNETNWTTRGDILKKIIAEVCKHSSAEERDLYGLINEKMVSETQLIEEGTLVKPSGHERTYAIPSGQYWYLDQWISTYRDVFVQECENSSIANLAPL